jgi:predicted Zn finger-like uncharacterized protein
MTDIARCPECGTRFKVNREQLEARGGLVRCGKCQHVFLAGQPAEAPALSEPGIPPVESPESEQAFQRLVEGSQPPLATATPPDDQIEDVIQIDVSEPPAWLAAPSKPARWPWILGIAILIPILLGLLLVQFKEQLQPYYPRAAVFLGLACSRADCYDRLPRHAELINIEYSGLESDPDHLENIWLQTRLRNLAAYPQVLPELQLTLLDGNEQPILRRTFKAEEYRKAADLELDVLQPGQDVDLKIPLQTSDIAPPSNYQLVVFYPGQKP